jgi:DNA modification methylase
MRESIARLTADGSLWVMICDEYAGEFACLLKTLGVTIRNWIKWYETFGVNCTTKFNRCSRHIFYCVKNNKRFVFDPDGVTRASDRQTKYHDDRANEWGKIWDDVWNIPRLVGTAKERIPEFPTQLPKALLRPIIGCASRVGDLVVDPFSGTATTGDEAISQGRRYLGIEKNARFAELSRLRLGAMQPTPPV